MPIIDSLRLTMSRDSTGQVSVIVDYTLKFSAAEVDADILFAERVDLYRRVGSLDHQGSKKITVEDEYRPLGEQEDLLVTTLTNSAVSIAKLGLQLHTPASWHRVFKHRLSDAELNTLLEPGREHTYVTVSISPVDVNADKKRVTLEMDVGDPYVAPETIDVEGVPIDLASDGTSLYVGTAEGALLKVDHDGALIEKTEIGHEIRSLKYDSGYLWALRADGIITRIDRYGNQSEFATDSVGAADIALSPQAIWVTDYGSNMVAKLDRSGTLIGKKAVRRGPWAIEATDDDYALAVSLGSGVVEWIEPTNMIVLSSHAVGLNPWAITVVDGTAWITNSRSGTISRIDLHSGTVGTLEVGAEPKGIDYGAGALWVALAKSNELVKIRLSDLMTVDVWPVGNEPDSVLFDGDRVFVANRSDHSVSMVRLS